MKAAIEKAIQELSKRAEKSTTPDETLKFSQAALNMANTLTALKNSGMLG